MNGDYPVYCTVPWHGIGDHNAHCLPVDPDNPELRLLRAIYGLCSQCNRTEEHEHPCRVCGKEQPLPDGSYCYHERKEL